MGNNQILERRSCPHAHRPALRWELTIITYALHASEQEGWPTLVTGQPPGFLVVAMAMAVATAA